MVGTLVRLTATAVVDPLTAVAALVSLGVGLGGRLNAAWLVAAGAATGLLHAFAA